jgi:hypothetical protein
MTTSKTRTSKTTITFTKSTEAKGSFKPENCHARNVSAHGPDDAYVRLARLGVILPHWHRARGECRHAPRVRRPRGGVTLWANPT